MKVYDIFVNKVANFTINTIRVKHLRRLVIHVTDHENRRVFVQSFVQRQSFIEQIPAKLGDKFPTYV